MKLVFRKGLQVYGKPDERIILRELVHGPIHAATGRLRFKRLEQRILICKNLGNDSRTYRMASKSVSRFLSGNVCEGRWHEVGECPLYKDEREREISVSKLGINEGGFRSTGLRDEGAIRE